ncbi:MAG: PhzF family phenazine biosynthesis protein [Dehalococcoidia bacterium]
MGVETDAWIRKNDDMKIPIYQVDAFTSEVFSGNPAAVCILDSWIDDNLLQSIASENNLSETAFLVRNDGGCDLRWFTPITEVALCGHATLASAFVLFTYRDWAEEEIRFHTRKSGQLVVGKGDGLLKMDFPSRPARSIISPSGLKEALGVTPIAVMDSSEDLLAVLESEKAVRELRPDFSALEQIESRGVVVTARGSQSDFVSRFFAPRVGIPEDPVTGSAHCVLVPYWSRELHKKNLHAFQISKRGGEVFCVDAGDRVKIAGRAVLYMEGAITI